MSRIVVSQFVTVDGVVEDPGGAESFEHGGWAFQFERGPDGGQVQARRGDGKRRAPAGPGHL